MGSKKPVLTGPLLVQYVCPSASLLRRWICLLWGDRHNWVPSLFLLFWKEHSGTIGEKVEELEVGAAWEGQGKERLGPPSSYGGDHAPCRKSVDEAGLRSRQALSTIALVLGRVLVVSATLVLCDLSGQGEFSAHGCAWPGGHWYGTRIENRGILCPRPILTTPSTGKIHMKHESLVPQLSPESRSLWVRTENELGGIFQLREREGTDSLSQTLGSPEEGHLN